MRHPDELEAERPDVDRTLLRRTSTSSVRVDQAVLGELRLDEAERQPGREDSGASPPAGSKEGRDVILVPVGQHDRVDRAAAR